MMTSRAVAGSPSEGRTLRVRVITSCTNRKLATARPVPAEQLYTGEQHRRLMAGVQRFRARFGLAALDLWIVSAKLGLVPGDRPLTSYDETFAGMGRQKIAARGAELNIPADLRAVLARGASVQLLLLGGDYLAACSFDGSVTIGAPTLALCGRSQLRLLHQVPNLTALPLGEADTRRFACGLVGMKGEVARRLLDVLAESPQRLDTLLASPTQLLDDLAACPAVRGEPRQHPAPPGMLVVDALPEN